MARGDASEPQKTLKTKQLPEARGSGKVLQNAAGTVVPSLRGAQAPHTKTPTPRQTEVRPATQSARGETYRREIPGKPSALKRPFLTGGSLLQVAGLQRYQRETCWDIKRNL